MSPHLDGAQAEPNDAGPEARRLEFETDHNSSKHHTKLGEVQDVVDVADKAERKGADQQSRPDSQHRTDAQPTRQGTAMTAAARNTTASCRNVSPIACCR